MFQYRKYISNRPKTKSEINRNKMDSILTANAAADSSCVGDARYTSCAPLVAPPADLRLDVVVSHYREPLTWLEDYREDAYNGFVRIFVYHKGGETDPRTFFTRESTEFVTRHVHWIPRDNVGLDQETFCFHILRILRDPAFHPAPLTFFTQAYFVDHCDLPAVMLSKCYATEATKLSGQQPCVIALGRRCEVQPCEWKGLNHKGKWLKELESGKCVPAAQSLGEYWTKWVPSSSGHPPPLPDKAINYIEGPIFMAKREALQSLNPDTVEDMWKTSTRAPYSEELHFLERLLPNVIAMSAATTTTTEEEEDMQSVIMRALSKIQFAGTCDPPVSMQRRDITIVQCEECASTTPEKAKKIFTQLQSANMTVARAHGYGYVTVAAPPEMCRAERGVHVINHLFSNIPKDSVVELVWMDEAQVFATIAGCLDVATWNVPQEAVFITSLESPDDKFGQLHDENAPPKLTRAFIVRTSDTARLLFKVWCEELDRRRSDGSEESESERVMQAFNVAYSSVFPEGRASDRARIAHLHWTVLCDSIVFPSPYVYMHSIDVTHALTVSSAISLIPRAKFNRHNEAKLIREGKLSATGFELKPID